MAFAVLSHSYVPMGPPYTRLDAAACPAVHFQLCVRTAFLPLWWCLRWRRMAVTLRLEKGGRESQHRLYRSRVSSLCLVLVLEEVMKDSISEGLRRLTPQRIALLCGNIATVPDTLKGLMKETFNSRTVNSFEPSTCISTSVVYF
jgi:hypothetical protein